MEWKAPAPAIWLTICSSQILGACLG